MAFILLKNKKVLKIPAILVFCTMLFIISPHLFCQESGYIITNESVFKGGLLKFTNSRSTSINFAETGSEEFRTYTSEQLLEYGFHLGTVYQSCTVNIIRKGRVLSMPLFLERTVTGKMNLYVVKYESRKYFFLGKDGPQLIPLNSNPESPKGTHRDALNHYLSDCEAIKPSIETSRLSKPYLTTLVERYNDCDNRLIPRFQLGLYMGLEFTTISFPKGKTNIPSLAEADFGMAAIPLVGMYSNLPIEGGISLHTEMGFKTGSFSSRVEERIGDDLTVEKVQIKLFTADLSVSLKYSSLNPRRRPYVHGGAGLAYAFTRDNDLERYQKTDSLEFTENFDWSEEAMSKVYFKVLFGAGVNFNLTGKYSMNIEARIEEILANDPPTPHFTGVGLVVGVEF